jgi:hypothetical protein
VTHEAVLPVEVVDAAGDEAGVEDDWDDGDDDELPHAEARIAIAEMTTIVPPKTPAR